MFKKIVCHQYGRVKHKSSSMSLSDIVIDVTHIKFCPGPCNSTTPEAGPPGPPRIINCQPWHAFKPYSGGRYIGFNYPMYEGGRLFLKNVRLCSSCNSRWHDMIYDSVDEQDMLEMSDEDAQRIMKKLKPALSPLQTSCKRKHVDLECSQ